MSLGAMMAGGNPDPNRGRAKNDFYPTPKEVTQALLSKYQARLEGSTIWEPCAGDGAMVDVMSSMGHEVIASDLEPRRDDIAELDFFSPTNIGFFDAVITNPSFSITPKMIPPLCSNHGVRFVALVMKASFWHAKSRQGLFNKHRPTAIHPLTWRPDFLGLGRPTMEVMWCVWDFMRRDSGYVTDYEPLMKPENA